MLHDSGLPHFLWGEALHHAVYLKNHSLTRALDDFTPLEMLMHSKPNISHLHPWGCKVWVHDKSGLKLDSVRAHVGVHPYPLSNPLRTF